MKRMNERASKMFSHRWHFNGIALIFVVSLLPLIQICNANENIRPIRRSGTEIGKVMQCTVTEALPICATNGTDAMLFSNACKLQEANNALRKENEIGSERRKRFTPVAIGICLNHCKLTCPTLYEPICAIDKRRMFKRHTFNNHCEMTRNGCLTETNWIKHSNGVCTAIDRFKSKKVVRRKSFTRRKKSRKSNTITCTMTYNPVCATLFGVKSTFINECLVQAENARTGKEWKIYSQGICAEDNLREATVDERMEGTTRNHNNAVLEPQQDTLMGYEPVPPPQNRGNVVVFEEPVFYRPQFENTKNFPTNSQISQTAKTVPHPKHMGLHVKNVVNIGQNIRLPQYQKIQNLYAYNRTAFNQRILKPQPFAIRQQKHSSSEGDSEVSESQANPQLEEWLQVYSGFDGTHPEDGLTAESNRRAQVHEYADIQQTNSDLANHQSTADAIPAESVRQNTKILNESTKSTDIRTTGDPKKPMFYILRNPMNIGSGKSPTQFHANIPNYPAPANPYLNPSIPLPQPLPPPNLSQFPVHPHSSLLFDPDLLKFPRLTNAPVRPSNTHTIANFLDSSKDTKDTKETNNKPTPVSSEWAAVGCPYGNIPVCAVFGSRTRTFANMCQLQLRNSQRQQGWIVLHEGACPLECHSFECSQKYEPVCVSWTGLKYTMFNDCHYRVAKCQDPELELISKGECKIEHSQVIEDDGIEKTTSTPTTTTTTTITQITKRKKIKKATTTPKPDKPKYRTAPVPRKFSSSFRAKILKNWQEANAAREDDISSEGSSLAESAIENSLEKISDMLEQSNVNIKQKFPMINSVTEQSAGVIDGTPAKALSQISTTPISPTSSTERFTIYGPNLGMHIMNLLRTKVLGRVSRELTSEEITA